MKKVFWVAIAIVLVSGLIFSGCAKQAPAPAPAPQQPAPVPAPAPEPAPAPAPEVEEEVVPAEEAAPPSMPMSLYENTEHGFSIEYPEGWFDFTTPADGLTGPYFSFLFQHPQALLFADVMVTYKTEEAILSEVILECKDGLYCTSEFELISEGNVTIGEGISGYEIVGKDDFGYGRVDKFRYIVLVREQQGFWVGVRGEAAYFDQQEEIINAILDSFKLLATYTF